MKVGFGNYGEVISPSDFEISAILQMTSKRFSISDFSSIGCSIKKYMEFDLGRIVN